MTSTLKGLAHVPNTTRVELTRAISDWVKSLPDSEAHTPSVYVSGIGYSPMRILEEVERQTEFGREFLEGLYAVDKRMGGSKKGAPVISLIRKSV
jgi:hypothetical protein